MKAVFLAGGSVASLLMGVIASPPVEPDAVVVFTGDIRGYLSPCGCSDPMIGGIQRMAGVVRQLKKQSGTVYVDLGNWLDGADRQEQLKAEALAETWKSLDADFVNVSSRDLMLGRSYIDTLKTIAPAISESETKSIAGLEVFGSRNGNVDDFSGNKSKVILIPEGLGSAKTAAQTAGPGLYIYSIQGDPTKSEIVEGDSTFVTVGDHCRFVGRIELVDGKWRNFRLIELGPEYENDADAARAYRAYLLRVAEENLLAEIPKTNSKTKFVGSDICISCHISEGRVWKRSLHAEAYRTLEQTGNSRDPECVACHVVGLTDKSGFSSKTKTPSMTAVGCESCHGAGSKHVQSPYRQYRTLGEKACLTCHTPANSPSFNFNEYWKKIKH